MPQMEIDRVIAELRVDVQRLASKLHQAKKQLDWHQYTWLGLDNPKIRENFEEFIRPETDAAKEIIARLTAEYRKVRAEYMRKKAQLTELESKRALSRWDANVREAVHEARRGMEDRFGPAMEELALSTLLAADAFELTDHPELIGSITKTVDEAESAMRTERTVANIAALVETVAAADSMGWAEAAPGRHEKALESALEVATTLRDEARRLLNPQMPADRVRLLQYDILVQMLDPETRITE